MDNFDQNLGYCFVTTKSNSIINRLSELNVPVISQKISGGRHQYFLSSRNINSPLFLSVINDQHDYSVKTLKQNFSRGQRFTQESDSLISLSYADDSYFGCVSDLWGILTHYWFEDKETFICSNNVFFVAHLSQQKISQKSIFEYLFFLTPLKERTWFSDIKSLRPSQSLFYDCKTHAVSVSPPIDLTEKLLDNHNNLNKRLEDVLDQFYCGSRKAIKERIAALCLSSGSDSRTILACLRRCGIPVKGFSFGKADYIETKEIENLTRQVQLPWELIDISNLEDRWDKTFYRTTFLSNGLANPLRTHYFDLYNAIPSNHVIFDGVLGSQFIKGDMPVNSALSEYHAKIIKESCSIGQVIDDHFDCLDEKFRSLMKEYIVDCYSNDLLDINTDQGFRNYQSYAFEYLASKLFSGPLLIAAKNHQLYIPFLSKNILRFFFNQKTGFATQVSLRNDFWSSIAKLKPEAKIVRLTDNDLYRSILNKGVSFKEVSEFPEIICRLIGKSRKELKKWKYNGFFRGQIDNKLVTNVVSEYAKQSCQVNIPLTEPTNDQNILKAIANISMIAEILHDMNNAEYEITEYDLLPITLTLPRVS